MDKKKAERCMLAALIALVIYGLACLYPAAWSPDSQKVVFPVLSGDTDDPDVTALVMTDLTGNPVREVARIDPERGKLGPASWSPDGKWIAYMKMEGKRATPSGQPASAPATKASLSLMLQNATSGGERFIWKKEAAPTPKHFYDIDFINPPAWTPDSKKLVIITSEKRVSAYIILDLNGKILKRVTLAQNAHPTLASVSPSGKYLIFMEEIRSKKKSVILHIMDVEGGSTKGIGEVPLFDDDLPAPIAWLPDSSALYFPSKEKRGKEEIGLVKRYRIKDGITRTVWSKKEADIVSLSLSGDAGTLAVDYGCDKLFCIEMVHVADGKSNFVFFMDGRHYSTAISPDGKWVTLNVPAGDKGPWVGLIISSGGTEMRFFAPDPESRKGIPAVLLTRLVGALVYLQEEENLKKPGPIGKTEALNSIKKFAEEMERIAREREEPLFKEAAAFGKVLFCLESMDQSPLDIRPKIAEHARKHLDAFLKAYPQRPFEAAFREEIEERLREKPPKPASAPAAR